MKIICVSVLAALSSLGALSVSEKWAARLESADAAYHAAVAKADNVRFYALQKATQERAKVLKSALTDATKAGDFDAATEIKSRLAAAETAGGVRARPKNVVKFGGHEYALSEDKATWHVAKRACEEMGGHLATVETAAENEGLLAMCQASKSEPWIGGSDEATEDRWLWVTGSPVTISIHHDNASGNQHFLLYHATLGTWDDSDSGTRRPFVCEWDN